MNFEVLEELMKEQKLTGVRLAELAGITNVHLSHIMNKQSPKVSLEVAIRIAKVLGVPVSVIAGDLRREDWERFKKVTQAFKGTS